MSKKKEQLIGTSNGYTMVVDFDPSAEKVGAGGLIPVKESLYSGTPWDLGSVLLPETGKNGVPVYRVGLHSTFNLRFNSAAPGGKVLESIDCCSAVFLPAMVVVTGGEQVAVSPVDLVTDLRFREGRRPLKLGLGGSGAMFEQGQVPQLMVPGRFGLVVHFAITWQGEAKAFRTDPELFVGPGDPLVTGLD